MVIAVGDGATASRRSCPSSAALLARPLLTLERVRVCKRDGVCSPSPRTAGDRRAGPRVWQKLMVYAGEQAATRPAALRRARAARCARAGAAGATALRGVWGYHGDHAPHGDSLWQLRRRVPVVTVSSTRPSGSGAGSRSSTS